MKNVFVSSMTSPKSGNPVANQFEIETPQGTYLQSYRSIIAFIPRDDGIEKTHIELDENDWNYSKTTSKYRNQFLGENTAETRKKIKSGEYILTDLN